MLSVHEILNSNTVKDLGVLVDHKLNFKAHIEDCVIRARQRSALIFRGFLSINISNLIAVESKCLDSVYLVVNALHRIK